MTGFYRNYHSIRFVSDVMMIRLKRAVPESDFARIATDHAHLTDGTPMRQTGPTEAEIRDGDHVDLPRVAVNYSAKGFAPLRPLLDDLNRH